MSLVFHPMQGLRHHLEASHDFFDFGFSEDAPHALPGGLGRALRLHMRARQRRACALHNCGAE